MIVALAGRRIDADDSKDVVFPLKNVPSVRERILNSFREKQAVALVCSAACGADLLALDAAGELKIRRYIILPFDRERFRRTSVTDRPGDWGKLFDRICDEVESEGNLTVLEASGSDKEAYRAVTVEILNRAESLSAAENEEILAVTVWEGKAREEGDETGTFVKEAEARNIKVENILTK